MDPITATLLRDVEHGGAPDQPDAIASELANFIRGAQSSLHVAIYDFRLDEAGPAYAQVVGTLRECARAGVDVRIAFDHGKGGTTEAGADPAPAGTQEFLDHAFAGTAVQYKPITDVNPMHLSPRLIHNKYMVRDGATPNAVVWTGSVNFDLDAWTYQENNIVQLASPPLAPYYETDFEELWTRGDIDTSGSNDTGSVPVGSAMVDVAFSPGEGNTITSRIVDLIQSASRRIKLASMLVASRPVLHALQDALWRTPPLEFAGIYDRTQMEETLRNWQEVEKNWDLLPLFHAVSGRMASKVSVPYDPAGKHNFMHAKVLVSDDAVFTGSYNLSHSATMNAENVLIIHDAQLANLYSEYVDALVNEYS